MRTETTLLKELAGIISYIDFDKNHGGADIEPALANARQVVERMKQQPMDIGELPFLLATMESAQSALPKGMAGFASAIDATHCEIERLAGDQSHWVYKPEQAAA